MSIPLERIQSVNTKQNLIQQVLDVVSLEIDTAGTVGKELKIHALEQSFATELQDHIRAEKKQTTSFEGQTVEDAEVKKEQIVLKLSPVDLLKIGRSNSFIKVDVIVKTIFDCRSINQFCIRPNTANGFRHNVCAAMAHYFKAIVIL